MSCDGCLAILDDQRVGGTDYGSEARQLVGQKLSSDVVQAWRLDTIGRILKEKRTGERSAPVVGERAKQARDH
jgi:hypothetical protein